MARERDDYRLSVSTVARVYGVSENYVRTRIVPEGGDGIEAIDLGTAKRPWYRVSESSARRYFERRQREENEVVVVR